jgi:hypothetical protein
MIFVIVFAAGIVLTGCGDALLSSRADLEHLKNRMDEKGLQQSDIYKEVRSLIDLIESKARLSSSQKKHIKKRSLEIDVELTEFLLKRPASSADSQPTEELCGRFIKKLIAEVTRAKDSAEVNRVAGKNIRLNKTYEALSPEQQLHLQDQIKVYKERAYITQVTLGLAPGAELTKPSVLAMFGHLSRRKAALKKRIKEGTPRAEITPILKRIDQMVAEHYPAFRQKISELL